ncbi:hypothetical protein DFJ73DRAFT_956339 [Zopfochytrium polystomum]|nr:hypothetical protein DFJ73DRAFT_956339 [Zopfochytrium polystomum]
MDDDLSASASADPNVPRPYKLPPEASSKKYVLCPTATVRINAPAAVVFAYITRPSTWPDWNSFVPRAEIRSGAPPPPPPTDPAAGGDDHSKPPEIAVGTRLVFYVNMTPTALAVPLPANAPAPKLYPSPELVTELTRPSSTPAAAPVAAARIWRTAWTSNQTLPAALLATPVGRIQELEESPDGKSCTYRTWEPMTGVLSYFVRSWYGAILDRRFLEWAADLKRVAEADPAAVAAATAEA